MHRDRMFGSASLALATMMCAWIAGCALEPQDGGIAGRGAVEQHQDDRLADRDAPCRDLGDESVVYRTQTRNTDFYECPDGNLELRIIDGEEAIYRPVVWVEYMDEPDRLPDYFRLHTDLDRTIAIVDYETAGFFTVPQPKDDQGYYIVGEALDDLLLDNSVTGRNNMINQMRNLPASCLDLPGGTNWETECAPYFCGNAQAVYDDLGDRAPDLGGQTPEQACSDAVARSLADAMAIPLTIPTFIEPGESDFENQLAVQRASAYFMGDLFDSVEGYGSAIALRSYWLLGEFAEMCDTSVNTVDDVANKAATVSGGVLLTALIFGLMADGLSGWALVAGFAILPFVSPLAALVITVATVAIFAVSLVVLFFDEVRDFITRFIDDIVNGRRQTYCIEP